MPKDMPPHSTVHGYIGLRDDDGTLKRLHRALYVACREKAGHEASSTAAIIGSQSVKGAENGALASTRRATMQATRSRTGSATSLSTRKTC